ncbi:hypothetical protein ACC676_39510, partial [Rhizobium ruizarguesonis]
VTKLDINSLSTVLLGLGVGGLVGLSAIGFVVRRHLGVALIGIPGVLAVIALLLIAAALKQRNCFGKIGARRQSRENGG